MELNEVVIVSAVRTPIGSFQGALSGVAATKLGSIVIAEALKRAKLKEADVDQVIMGNVLSAGLGQAPAGQAALGAGLPKTVECPHGQQGLRLRSQSGDAGGAGDSLGRNGGGGRRRYGKHDQCALSLAQGT
jgi:Thiolase, N-terminal domain